METDGSAVTPISLPGTLAEANHSDDENTQAPGESERSGTPVRLTPIEMRPAESKAAPIEMKPAQTKPAAASRPASQEKPHGGGTSRKKELPPSVRRRRPSLADVMGGDSSDPNVQQEIAKKIAQASAAQTSNAGRGAIVASDDDEYGTGGALRNPDRLQIVVMPTLTAMATVTFCVTWSLWTKITEPLILSDPPPPVPPDDYNPPIEGEPMQHYVLNEPLGAFIGVVSIIFALMYTSVYHDATERQSHIRNALAQEAGGVHTAMLLVRTLDADDDVNKTRALLLFSSYIENLASGIFFKSTMRATNAVLISSIEALYAAVPFLSEIASDGEGDEMDRVLIQRVVDSLNRVTEARHQRESAERGSSSILTFVFLIMLAMFTFFGVFFLQIGSSALTSCVIAMTGLSLTLAIGILVDVSLPWRGFITVDTGIFISIQKDISLVLDLEQDHQHEPESSNDQPQIDGADSDESDEIVNGDDAYTTVGGQSTTDGVSSSASGGDRSPTSTRGRRKRPERTKSMKTGLDAEIHLHQAVAGDIQRAASRKGSMFNSADFEREWKQQS